MTSKAALPQSWLDSTRYPFESRFIHLEEGKMHYVDEGSGPVILFVHGTPTWSFLYRKYIRELSVKYRCIAIDHMGFGLSEKPASFSGKPEDHAQNLAEFIRRLELKDITLVVHDFGGPIGLGVANKMPERIQNIVLFNTWLWSIKNEKEVRRVDGIINSWMGKFLYLNLNFSPRFLIKQGISNKKNLSKEVHQHYIKPFPNKDSRRSLLNIAKSLAGSSDWYEKQWNKLQVLKDKNWLILWGKKDKFIDVHFLERWKNRLPHAEVKVFECGHFVQEENAMESIQYLEEFMVKYP